MSTLNLEQLAELEELTETAGEAFLTDLIASFQTESIKLIESIRQAITSHDLVMVEKFSHKLKSSASSIGAREVAKFSQLLETHSREKKTAELENFYQSLESSFKSEAEELRTYSANRCKK